ARQQQQAVRLPPRRAQAFTAAPRAPSQDPRAWAPRAPSAAPRALPPTPTFAPRNERDDRDERDEDTIIVSHPAIRSSDDRPRRRSEALPAAAPSGEPPTDGKKAARPRTLPRGKHKVERVD
ncbi:MAG TPA: hypothetical protein VGB85_14225, partial [Nannocystis sp.]